MPRVRARHGPWLRPWRPCMVGLCMLVIKTATLLCLVMHHLNPYPPPGNVVGTVHGRRDTRTAAGGAPEPARYPPMASRDPLSLRGGGQPNSGGHTRIDASTLCRSGCFKAMLRMLRMRASTSLICQNTPRRRCSEPSSSWPSRDLGGLMRLLWRCEGIW